MNAWMSAIEHRFLEVLCKEDTSVYYVNLKNDSTEPLKVEMAANVSKISEVQPGKISSYSKMIALYCKKCVAEKDKKEFLEVMKWEYLLERLEEAESFLYQYEGISNPQGHHYYEMQAVRVNKTMFDGQAVVMFHCIDDIITRELRYQRELERTAYSDALTGIRNRAAFRKELPAFGSHPGAACVIADVNNLKLCNDRYGHQEGDTIIKDMAECICKAFEGLGNCYRIGGDEFCVLLPQGDETQLIALVGYLEELISKKNKTRVMNMSIAVGYAIRDGMEESMEHLFNRGDEMMYDVKKRMKNAFPVYLEERIGNYLNVLEILSKTTDDYLFLMDINKDNSWFFGDINRKYPIQEKGQLITSADVFRAVHPKDRELLKNDMEQIASGKKKTHNLNYRWVTREGETVWISCRGTVLEDNKGKPFVLIGKVSDTALRYLYHPLTKLFNKEKLLMDLKNGLLEKNKGYFMYLGIDNLESIRLQYGNTISNDMIQQCAEFLEQDAMVQNIWHVENGCFVLYLETETEDDVQKVFRRFSEQMTDICTFSAGVVPDNSFMFGNENDLYSCAEMTYEKAKEVGMGTLNFFAESDLQKRLKNIRFLEEIRESIKNGCKGFYLCYQPQIRTGNYDVYGAEALLRYHSEKQGEVYPDEFIPLLEESKLINPVGLWVLETALVQCREWRKTKPEFHIGVNFSAIQLQEETIAEQILEALKKAGLPGNALTVELTESIQLTGIRNFSKIFKRLRDAGIELSIDDFGTGYASMSYLKELNVNEVKIDRLFVRGVEEATYNYRLLSNMIEFARGNDIRICCEGVEDVHELVVLEGLSPNLIQGYLFSKPCKKEDFENCFIDCETQRHKEYERLVQQIYQYKGRMHMIYFNSKDILRETEVGLWIIRIKREEDYFELHADETMEYILGVDKKYMPEDCYAFWFHRIKPEFLEYVNKNVDRMINSNKVVQLQYPWIHPLYGEVVVRCSGKRIADSDGMITLEGYHRIISTIEET